MTPEDILSKLSAFLLVLMDRLDGEGGLQFSEQELAAAEGRHIDATAHADGSWSAAERKCEEKPAFQFKVVATGRVINPGDPDYPTT